LGDRAEVVLFLIRNGFVLGEDFSIDANGDMMIGNPDAFFALSVFMDSISEI
jgi:hypothetical protein